MSTRARPVLALTLLSLVLLLPRPSWAPDQNVRAPDQGTFYIDRFGLGANLDSPLFPPSPLVVTRKKDHLHIGPAQGYPANGFVKTNPTIPPGYRVTGVRVCYSLTKPGPGPGSGPPSEITRLRLAQFDEAAGGYAVQFNDNVAGTGPAVFHQMVCLDSNDLGRTGNFLACLDPFVAPIEVSLRVNLEDSPAEMLIHALGVHYDLNCTPTFLGSGP